jgi:hypothetical protein
MGLASFGFGLSFHHNRLTALVRAAIPAHAVRNDGLVTLWAVLHALALQVVVAPAMPLTGLRRASLRYCHDGYSCSIFDSVRFVMIEIRNEALRPIVRRVNFTSLGLHCVQHFLLKAHYDRRRDRDRNFVGVET